MGRRGTEGEFAAFVAECSPRMLRVAFLLTGQQSAAEDLLQASLEKLYVVWDRLRPTLHRLSTYAASSIRRTFPRGGGGCARCSPNRHRNTLSNETRTPNTTTVTGCGDWFSASRRCSDR